MKAAVNADYGPPEVIKIKSIPKPSLNKNEILVEVYASSVNRTDCGFLRAKPFVTRAFSGLLRPRYSSLGCEFAGEVVENGELVTQFKIGDRVFGFDDSGWGGHAEFKKIAEHKMVTTIPKNISYEQAAASTEGVHYALSYVRVLQKLGVKKVLVHGATGAIGSAAVQLLKHAGMYVAATSTPKNIDLVKSLGAEKVIDWQKDDFTKTDDTFDSVFDAVGRSTFGACKPLLKRGGVYIATELGPGGQNPLLGILSPIFRLFGAKYVLFPLPKAGKEVIEFLRARLKAGDFAPVIDRKYKLEDIVQAYTYVESGQKTGNVVITIKSSTH